MVLQAVVIKNPKHDLSEYISRFIFALTFRCYCCSFSTRGLEKFSFRVNVSFVELCIWFDDLEYFHYLFLLLFWMLNCRYGGYVYLYTINSWCYSRYVQFCAIRKGHKSQLNVIFYLSVCWEFEGLRKWGIKRLHENEFTR